MVFAFMAFFILAAAATAVLADKPPDSLFRQVTTTSQLVHRGLCDVESMKKSDVPCLIYYDGANELVWLVLFDNKEVTHVIAAKDKKESLIWCRQDVCL